MSSKFIEMLFIIVMRFKWKHIAWMLTVSFCMSWWLMSFFEPKADIIKPSVYWWYFLMDVLRGGYSGYMPASVGGRIVSMLSFFVNGILFVAAICKTAGYFYEHSQKKKKGLARMKKENHIVLLGYRPGESDLMIEQLTSDPVLERPVVLCSKRLSENPFPGKIDFVNGDTSDEGTLARACIGTAAVIVVNGHDSDERTVMVTIVANSMARKDAHIVAYLDSYEKTHILKKVNPKIECVTSLRPLLLAQAVRNPGSTKLIHELASFDNPGTNYRINIPASAAEATFHMAMIVLHLEYGAIIIGYADSHECDANIKLNPLGDTKIKGGMALFYIARHPIDRIIDWSVLQTAPEADMASAI